MRKLIGLFLIIFVLAALVSPAGAVPVADLTALARYFDAESLVFVSFRTDDGYIETLDALIARITALMPEDQRMSTSLRETLDMLFASFPGGGGTFDEIARPWLGATAAFGIKTFNALFDADRNNDGDIPFMVAIANRDRAAAVEFFTRLYDVNGRNTQVFTVTDEGAYTLFTPGSDFGSPPYLYIDDQVVLLGRGADLFPTGGLPMPSLADHEPFTSAFAALPGDSYNIGAYLNFPAFVSSVISMTNATQVMGGANDPMTAAMLDQIEAAYAALGPQVWGFTIADGRSLIADIVQIGDVDAMMAAAPTGVMINYPPLDPAFAARIPAGAPAVILGSQLGPLVQNFLTTLQTQAETLAQAFDADVEEIQQALAQIDFAVQGLTGLDLEDEILSWMDGQYALYLTISPALGDVRSAQDIVRLDVLPAQAALVVETSNPELSAELVSGIGAALEAFGGDDIVITTEEMGGGSAVVVTVPNTGVSYPVEIVFASNDDVFAIGTRDAVAFSLAPNGPSLADDPLYQEALGYALPGSATTLYLAGAGLDPLVNLVDIASPSMSRDAENLAFVLDLFHTSSITVQVNDTNQVFRAVMTLPE